VFFAGVFTAALSVPRPGDRDVEEKDPEVIRLTRTKKPETVATDEARARRRGHPVRLRHAALARRSSCAAAAAATDPARRRRAHQVIIPPATAADCTNCSATRVAYMAAVPALLLQAVPHGIHEHG
jgi:hypothetical protein